MHHASTTLRASARKVGLVLGLAIALGSVAGPAGPAAPAAAGGVDFMYPVQDHYEPGETATVVGYASAGAGAAARSGGVADGPYHGELETTRASGGRVDLGPATVTETGRRDRYAVRVSITFTVPAGLAPGSYEIFVCDAGCGYTVGELYNGTIHVGIEPPDAIDRGWLVEDPAVAELPDDALVSGIPAARIRAGEAGVPWYDAPPAPLPAPAPEAADPEPEPEPDVVTADPASSGRAASPAEGEDGTLGPADVAPWLLPLVLVATVWRMARRDRRGEVVPRTPVPESGAAAEAAAEPAREPIRL